MLLREHGLRRLVLYHVNLQEMAPALFLQPGAGGGHTGVVTEKTWGLYCFELESSEA